jgi:hypothetical protein
LAYYFNLKNTCQEYPTNILYLKMIAKNFLQTFSISKKLAKNIEQAFSILKILVKNVWQAFSI